MPASIVAFVSAAALLQPAQALDNGIGEKPPMGYNTWNDLGCKNMNEDNIKAIADAMASNGLRDAGFEYLNLDDCWMDSKRESTGRLQGDRERFPSGMSSLANYVHSKGLKFGIYSDRGSKTCQGLPASLGFEEVDAQTFADWGVDYLKEDNCHSSTGPNDRDQLFAEYSLMRDSLNSTGRPIFFSVCGGGDNHPWNDITYYATDSRGGAKLANAWRISSDVVEWQSCQLAYLATMSLAKHGGKGGFNDPDMLLGSSSSAARTLKPERSRTQFNLWAILMAPLMIGANIRELNAYDLATYTNMDIIAVNQDVLAKQGKRVAYMGNLPQFSLAVWARELADGALAMAFVNNHGESATITCHGNCWSQLGVKTGLQYDVKDLWAHGAAAMPLAVSGEDYTVQVALGNGASTMLLFTPSVVMHEVAIQI